MEEYFHLGHPYVRDYSLNPSTTWVLTMNPMMANILSRATFAEVNATFRGSIEVEYLLHFVRIDFHFLQCKFMRDT